jgi:hypothetical protein
MIINLVIAKEVQSAINKGADTLQKIRRQTKRGERQIGEALAYLMLTAKTTRTRTRSDGKPLYLPTPSRRTCFDDAPLSFSTLRGLMPRARSLRA